MLPMSTITPMGNADEVIDDLCSSADAAAYELPRYQEEAHGKGLDQGTKQEQTVILGGFPGEFDRTCYCPDLCE